MVMFHKVTKTFPFMQIFFRFSAFFPQKSSFFHQNRGYFPQIPIYFNIVFFECFWGSIVLQCFVALIDF